MKNVIFFLVFLSPIAISAQNEFAATAFYTDFKKIAADAQTGFITSKGMERAGEYPELQTEYKVKLTLSGADSGKIIFPLKGNPYAVYYFTPYKNRIKTDQQALSLREAILVGYEQPLYLRTETVIVDSRSFSNTWFFSDANESVTSRALFRTNIYYKDEKYYLLLEIRGNSSEQ